MRLDSLTIQNFRSITKAYKLPLSSSTVLIGPNNEGKSNVLRALVLATRMLIGRRRSEPAFSPPRSRFGREADYDWERDFPLHLQEKEPEGNSVFVLEYELTSQEVDDFRTVIGSRLNGTLPLRMAIGTKAIPTVTVHKKGPGGKALSKKAPKIAEFVAERIELEYIPAVRTAVSAQRIVDAMVARELSALESGQDYVEALEQIAKIQDPVLRELSESIKSTLIQFLPAVKSVDVRAPMERRFEALRRCEIYIDDGSMTELRYKGDGVQSLAALGLMRHASAKSSLGKNVVVAIEEPESHLHPKAIHELRGGVEQLAAKHQVVVTTHCPLFVSRRHVESNIIVNNRKAKAATSVDEIRGILGVRAADNLLHAELVLVVEGEDDRGSVGALLANASTPLMEALRSNRLTIDTLGGASNLAYKLGLLRDALCECHVFLDSDAAGKQAYERARETRLLADADVNFTNCQGMNEAEFEDLLAVDLVNKVLAENYRITNPQVPKDARRKKWSRRMELVFGNAGKQWSNRTCSELKLVVAEAVKSNPSAALNPNRRSVFDALVSALEQRLEDAQIPAGTPTQELSASGEEQA
jgi:putative ATP-dependent endonuclease of the OLD family